MRRLSWFVGYPLVTLTLLFVVGMPNPDADWRSWAVLAAMLLFFGGFGYWMTTPEPPR